MSNIDQRGFNNQRSGFVSAREAAGELGVKVRTLYSYASRGLVQSVPTPEGRAHLYATADLARLKARHDARAGHGAVAAGALRWGEPVLESAITEIRADDPAYRGVALSSLLRRGASFEAVAELLWTGALPSEPVSWPRRRAAHLPSSLVPHGTPPAAALRAVVPALALADATRFDAPPAREHARARTMIRALGAALSLGLDRRRFRAAFGESTIAGVVATALGAPRRVAARRAIDRALIVCADHELNVSAFAARVVASAGADLYACVAAALDAFSGPRHGGASARVAALLSEVGSPRRARSVIAARARRGDALPGFGHPLYPNGDPRVPPLLAEARELDKRRRRTATLFAVIDAMRAADREPPNLDVALLALCLALEVPPGSAAVIFAVGRSAGWIAHALEQREAGYLLRPRARYVGPSSAS
jgi:citrate synthase